VMQAVSILSTLSTSSSLMDQMTVLLANQSLSSQYEAHVPFRSNDVTSVKVSSSSSLSSTTAKDLKKLINRLEGQIKELDIDEDNDPVKRRDINLQMSAARQQLSDLKK